MKEKVTIFIKAIYCKLHSILLSLYKLNLITSILSFQAWNEELDCKELEKEEKLSFKIKFHLFKKITIFILVLVSLYVFTNCRANRRENKNLLFALVSVNPQSPKAYFSYPGRYTDSVKKREVMEVILSLIENANDSLKIYAYSFNNPEIIAKLVEAKKRGVKIEIVGDKEHNYDLLQENGFSVNIWKQSGLHHIKVLLIDDRILFTGTGNFSRYGLINDWNGYIQMEIEEKNRALVQEFLDEKLIEPVLLTNGITFISSPENGFLSQDLLLEKVDSAKVSIEYLIFDHFDSVLTHALKQATARGVRVTGVYDSPVDDEGEYLVNSFYGLGSGIYRDGNEDIIETAKFPEGGLLHHKTMIIDGKILLSGSYNYSASAKDSNREILYMTEDLYLVSEFQKEFTRVRDKSYLLPMEKYYSVTDNKKLELNGIDGNTLCLPKPIHSPMIELGEGIWKGYLYYQKVENSNCFSLTSFANISSGISEISKADFSSLDFLWNQFKVYDRNSNVSYEYSNGKKIFSPSKPIDQKNPYYLSFTNTRIYFEMKEDLEIEGKPIYLWLPGKEIRKGNLAKPNPQELGYTANISTTYSERGYAVAFIEGVEKTYYFCYKDKTRSGKNSLEYLSKKIFMQQKIGLGQSGRFESCIEN